MDRPSIDLLERLAGARGLTMRPPSISGWLTASDGTRLHYLDWPGESEPLILLHGGALSAHTFDLLALALTSAVRCIALDLRGHGLSGWSDDYRIARSAADVVELAHHLAVPRLHLAGMSLGGCVAGHAAAGLGGRLASLAFIDVGPEVNFAVTARMRTFMAAPRSEAGAEDVVRRALALSPRTDRGLMLYRYQSLLRQTASGVAWRADRRRPTDFPHILHHLRLLEALAPGVGCPALVVRGGRSRVISAAAAGTFASLFPSGATAVVPDAGHNVQEDQPAALADLLHSLMTRRRPDDGPDPAVRRPTARV